MTNEEEKMAALGLAIKDVNSLLDDDSNRQFTIDTINLFNGKNDYTIKFFPNGDPDILAFFKNIISPEELEGSFDNLPGIIPIRAYLECCCYAANSLLSI